jgi:hypothetical protein
MKTLSSTSDLQSHPLGERRKGTDRRLTTSFRLRFEGPRRRRSSGRRKGDPGGYVDIYDRGSWGIASAVMVMSFLDAILTVLQIQRGVVREANPIMNMTLTWGGIYAFFCLKALMTAFALAIIIVHKEWALARYMARMCLWFYLVIMFYHLYLVSGYAGAAARFFMPP